MKLNLQVTRLQDGAKVPVHVVAAGKLDFQQTASMGWQTNWKTMDTAYFPNRVALKTEEQELLGLMSYFCDDRTKLLPARKSSCQMFWMVKL